MAGTPWSCSRCTFENAAPLRQCAICMGPRTVEKDSSRFEPKKSTAQSLLVRVGSSEAQEQQRVRKKLQQLTELGIELPSDQLLALLEKNCYSVHVAACDYFERLAKSERVDADKDQESKNKIEETLRILEQTDADWRVLGKTTMGATVNRSGAKLQVGEQVLLQAENAGKKRLRPGMAAASAASGGIVRIASMEHTQIGRLAREMEVLLHPLMKSGLLRLGGVCEIPPASRMFASFDLTVFVYVSELAFEVFKEGHTNFHLSDAFFSVFQMLNACEISATSTATTRAASEVLEDVSSQVNPEDLDTLFSECLGADDLHSTAGGSQTDPSTQLAPYLNAIELRDHQKQALRWMLWRENQARDRNAGSEQEVHNPLWEERRFRSQGSYYVNPFEKSASLTRPEPPAPCLGGILADDMGMGKTMMILSLIAHQKHFGKLASTNMHVLPSRTRDVTGNTLVVCPLSLLHQWKNEAEERFLSSTLSVYVYYGDERSSGSSEPFANSDVVLTTYGVLSAEHDKNGLLAVTEWTRVILDEAHSIKNRSTGYFKACSSIRAAHRWCLTGTPIQNSLDDMFSLLSFLQYEPWSRVAWWKRVISKPYEDGDDVNALGRLKVILTPMLLRRTKHSKDKEGNMIVQLPPKHVQLVKLDFSPVERAFYQAVFDKSRAEFNGFVARGSAMSSYVAIFALLLRLRQACDHPLLALGKDFEQAAKADDASTKTATTPPVRSSFQPQQNETSEAYYQRIAARLQQDMQASNRTQLLEDSSSAGEMEAASSSGGGLTKLYIQSVIAQVEDGLDSQECPICLDPPQDAVLTPCAHLLCEPCLRESLSNDPDNSCPVCRTVVDMNKVFKLPPPSTSNTASGGDTNIVVEPTSEEHISENSVTVNDDGTGFESAKLQQLLRDLKAIKLENANAESPGQKRKVVVFSQWTSMLEMVSQLLKRNGFSHCMFNGALNQEARERVLTKFAKDPDMEVLVISLKAGGVGLNLTCASVVILLDPWWNPGVEEQAIDRVHRLGQTRDVLVKRYVVKDTVEDMILQLQQRKEKLAKHVLVVAKTHDDRRSERLNLDDLRSFFHN